jgi:hypothetical protein
VQIWVDADACPGVIKDILVRAAERHELVLILVANKPLWLPRSPQVRSMQVPAGLDVADSRIAESMQPGDIVVTADIPLAAAVVARGGHALDPRGELYTTENIGERLAVRNLLNELRDTGVSTGGPAAFGRRDRQAFANQLDRLLTRLLRGSG